ncbi:hypothetical protein NC653_004561 [Populus alba x Populus x berolinensis]|uniref:Uncharacterized protein n=2 Tax=Populus TaxID=3689 RepID=A0A4U5N9H7_POPAL|nr:hypothetical protein NC653_004561 [Populus alba x Populus x berolinensis]TKR79659.1 hypothetical protein D5086_0000270270 [Populus alba]
MATDKTRPNIIETASIGAKETHGSAVVAAPSDALSRTKISVVLKQSSTRSCDINGLCFSFRAPEDFVLDGSVRLQIALKTDKSRLEDTATNEQRMVIRIQSFLEHRKHQPKFSIPWET